LRCIGFRDLHLASKIDLTGRRFTSMVAIGHDNVIELTLTAYGSAGLRRHGRRINQNLVFAYVQKQPVEVELLFLRKPRPLPDAGKKLFHETTRCRSTYRAATASFTVLVTFVRTVASLGKSIMSSSGSVMNFRLDPLVREIKNMLFEGVTGMTTWTAASTPFTSSKKFCFPSSISSIRSLLFPPHPQGEFPLSQGRGLGTVALRARTRRAPHILFLSPANSFSTSAIITSAPANSIFPTRCQRITP